MYTIIAGAIAGLMLAALAWVMVRELPIAASVKESLFRVPPPNDAQLTSFWAPLYRFSHFVSKWTLFMGHVLIAILLYWFMGPTIMAHITVVCFEILWILIATPLGISVYGQEYELDTEPSYRWYGSPAYAY